MKTQKERGHITPAGFGTLFPMLLSYTDGKFFKRQRLAGERTQCRTETGCDNGGSKTLAATSATTIKCVPSGRSTVSR